MQESFAGFKKSCTFALAIQRNGIDGALEKAPNLLKKALIWRGGGIGRRATLRW